MKKQRIKLWLVGVIGLVCIGLFVFVSMPLNDRTRPQATDTIPGIYEQTNNPDESETGYVTADDERDDNTPWHTTVQSLVAKLLDQQGATGYRSKNVSKYVTINDREYPLRTYRTLLQPNDPNGSQWWTSYSGLESVWDSTPGAYETTLAIIDTGFALQHEEFINRWQHNGGEQGSTAFEASSQLNCTDRELALDYACNLVDDDVDGIVDNESGAAPYENPSRRNCSDQGVPLNKSCNRVDDDNNGYTDDVTGWDAINQDNSVQAGELNPTGSGTTHGTMVAGTAAATGNNGKGIAGVNWQTKLLPIQALDDDGYGDTRSVGRAIRYATTQRVDVINISLGTDFHDPYVNEAVEAATAAGITIVASSGNDGCDCIVYPARYPEVVAVGAQTNDGTKASFSSWGESLDVVAPGTGMTLPSWSTTNQTARYVSGAAGTSFASPLVAGAIALMKSHRPDATPLQLIAGLRETGVRTHNGTGYAPDGQYGYGGIDANAFQSRMTLPRHEQQQYLFSPVSAGDYLQSDLEATGSYRAIDCGSQQTSMPLYELKKSGSTFYTISEVEVRRAVTLGYIKTNFAYICMAQPHDTTDLVRLLNIFREFKNLSTKP